MTDQLTPEELKNYTGLDKPGWQSLWLRKRGIVHQRRGKDMAVVVTWTQINRTAKPAEESAWERIDRQRHEERMAARALIPKEEWEIEPPPREKPVRDEAYYVARKRHWKRMRQVRKRHATPAWADLAAIEAIYQEAMRLEVETGEPHEVDHIIPLSHPLVCGLHVHWNLRAITKTENRRKSNGLQCS